MSWVRVPPGTQARKSPEHRLFQWFWDFLCAKIKVKYFRIIWKYS